MPSTVLLVKADVLSRLALADYLRSAGYRVVEASNDDEARAVLLAEDIDVLLCDVTNTSITTGFNLVQWARARCPRTRLLLKAGTWSMAEAATELCGSPAYSCADHIRRMAGRYGQTGD